MLTRILGGKFFGLRIWRQANQRTIFRTWVLNIWPRGYVPIFVYVPNLSTWSRTVFTEVQYNGSQQLQNESLVLLRGLLYFEGSHFCVNCSFNLTTPVHMEMLALTGLSLCTDVWNLRRASESGPFELRENAGEGNSEPY